MLTFKDIPLHDREAKVAVLMAAGLDEKIARAAYRLELLRQEKSRVRLMFGWEGDRLLCDRVVSDGRY